MASSPKTYGSGRGGFTLRGINEIIYNLGQETRAKLIENSEDDPFGEDEVLIPIPSTPTEQGKPVIFTMKRRDAKDSNFVRVHVHFRGENEEAKPTNISVGIREREAADNDFSLSGGDLKIPMIARGKSFELSQQSRRAHLFRYDVECTRRKDPK